VLAAHHALKVGSHQLGNVADAPSTRKIDAKRSLQSSVDAHSDSKHREVVLMPPAEASPRHVFNPGLGRAVYQSTWQASAASQVVALANASAQAQAAVSDSQDGYLLRQRLRMSGGILGTAEAASLRRSRPHLKWLAELFFK